MTRTEALLEKANKSFTPNYKPLPLVVERGEGSWVWDAEGRRYLDLIAGIATVALGHCHPVVLRALEEQARKLWHVSNLFYNAPSIELAEELAATTSFGKRVFLCNSGAESNEAMLKLARKYHTDRGDSGRHEIIACHRSFHGRTMFALSATGQPKYQEGFAPLVPGIRHVAYGDLSELEAALGPKTAAFIVEPILGEAGVVSPPEGYLKRAGELTRQAGALLLFDEVQTGMGRTGRMWAHEWEGVTPDLMSAAKALANGFPMGAMIATEEVGRHLTAGSHGTTFGGNALGSAVALAVVREIVRILPEANAAAETFRKQLEAALVPDLVESVRGRGFLMSLVLRSADAADVVRRAREEGLLINGIGNNVLRLAPALTFGSEEAAAAVDRLRRAISAAEPRKV